MGKTDVLVVGGSAAGVVAAVTGKSSYPEKTFTLVRQDKQCLVPCGIPYVFGSLESSAKNLIADAALDKAGVQIKVGKVTSIDPKNKICFTEDKQEITFEKLILALGSVPVIPSWLQGVDKENVFTIPKSKEYLDGALQKLKTARKILTIGGGFIGVEVSDELNKQNKDVTIVEILPHLLALAFDEEISTQAERLLSERGVHLKTGIGAKELVGNHKVKGVLLDNGNTLEADAVVLSMGYKPNSQLAQQAGIAINKSGFIIIDEYMRTEDPDIFAVGDCALKRDFFTRKHTSIMLASTACAEARIAGMNLYKLCTLKTFGGTIAIFSTAIGDTGFAAAGLTERRAIEEGFDVATGIFEGVDKHPATLANTHKQIVKLIVARGSGIILGGEVVGGISVGELINLIGFIIQNRITISSILTAQIGTHPLLTGPPTAYPLIKAAEVVAKKI